MTKARTVLQVVNSSMHSIYVRLNHIIFIPLAALFLLGCNNTEHKADEDPKDTIQTTDTSSPKMVISEMDTPTAVAVKPPPPPPPVAHKEYPPPDDPPPIEVKYDDVVAPAEDYSDADPVMAPSEPEIFTYVEQMPEYPGGSEALYQFIKNNLRYPPLAVENGIEGKVVVKFIVSKTGQVKEPVVIKDIGFGTKEEALRIVKLMPDWKPGKQNGRPVHIWYMLPIKFQLH